MLSLFGSLGLGARALQVDQEGVAVAGQNLANANNTGYSRQVLNLQTSAPVDGGNGTEGTGVEAAGIEQIRNSILDQQIQGETSITSYLQSQQSALQDAEAGLGEQLQADASTSSTSGTTGVGSTGGLASSLQGLFNAFQTLSTSPSSVSDRQAVISQAQELAGGFKQATQGLAGLRTQLNGSLQSGLANANDLLTSIAGLNQQIAVTEASTGGTANDLRDLRQQKVESLAQLVDCQTAAGNNGAVDISVGGQLLVTDSTVADKLQSYDAGGGQLLVQTKTGGASVTLSGGSVQGTIEARDNALSSLQTGLNNLASQLISSVNAVYSPGYDLHGNTGASFFSGNDASNIGVNTTLVSDPTTLQAAGLAGAAGDNQVALALAQLGGAAQAALGNQTFSQNYASTVTALGSAIQSVSDQLADHQVIQKSLTQQRTSASGVSLDEEMTNLLTYQRAYEASAHLVSTVNQMLTDLIAMKTT
jgi:flagellar hook-associated protein 1